MTPTGTPARLPPALRRLAYYCVGITLVTAAYFLYAINTVPPTAEHDTWLSEIGEGVGEIALWAMVFIYARTALKLALGKGPISKRLLPDYQAPRTPSVIKRLLVWLDRTHVHIGIATVALTFLHIVLMGMPWHNAFFIAVVGLLIWQTVFGMFLRWRTAPGSVKRFSYSVHAQLITGVMLGIFAYAGHMLVDN